jgi:hypothetical protein
MPQVAFEPMIPAFQQAKTVHALDRAANVIGQLIITISKSNILNCKEILINCTILCMWNLGMEIILGKEFGIHLMRLIK